MTRTVKSVEQIKSQAFLRASEIAAVLGLSMTGVYRVIGSPGFPAPVAVPGRKNRAWRTADVMKWASQI